jgi:hypothetical protein
MGKTSHKLRKKPTSRTGTAKVQYALQLPDRLTGLVTTYNKKEYNFCFNN